MVYLMNVFACHRNDNCCLNMFQKYECKFNPTEYKCRKIVVIHFTIALTIAKIVN